ncbi:hypothetical protein F8388_020825 [Cannabis sativa]|uniref:Uncharacterized protein n=1 Tax=Cannabis sativa TaxID=3483 RepID=A0A7J6FKE0_CANSA|nr:hypothetical protein F8388_020825 [Cannabis sativa]
MVRVLVKKSSLNVKKGAWSREEDTVLRECIDKYGEGKWHLVPLRAGLSRCRKSCRLRWLNYLKPDIKRGEFEEDEVDLLLRLHKLLGNRQINTRWSLIAGRIPGRTANDVKNYWNTHQRKKMVIINIDQSNKLNNNNNKDDKAWSNMVIKPRPTRIIRSQLSAMMNNNTQQPVIDHDQTNNKNYCWRELLNNNITEDDDQIIQGYIEKPLINSGLANNNHDHDHVVSECNDYYFRGNSTSDDQFVNNDHDYHNFLTDFNINDIDMHLWDL